MSVSKSVLLWFSPGGTTKTVVESIGKGLNMPFRCIDMTLPEGRSKAVELDPSELVVIGFPVYAGRLPEMHPLIFDKLPKGNNPVVPVVVYGNREYDDTLLELADLCVAKGYELTAAGCFVGQHSFEPSLAAGRPDAADQEAASSFGEQIRVAVQAGKRLALTDIPGKRPYKEIMQSLRAIAAPVGDAATCTKCLLCVENCPMGAIPADNPLTTNTQTCAMCAACIAVCPVQSRHIASPMLHQHMLEIARNNAEPKQPAVFLPK